jgi:hypothetical protein
VEHLVACKEAPMEVRRDIAAKSTSAKVRRAAELAGIFVEASTSKKQPTSSVPAPLPAVNPSWRAFPPICAPPWYRQLPPSFNVAGNNTPFAHKRPRVGTSLPIAEDKAVDAPTGTADKVTASPDVAMAPPPATRNCGPEYTCDDTVASTASTPTRKCGGRRTNNDIWHHVSRTLECDGSHKQVCKYCTHKRQSHQLQVTVWVEHLVACKEAPMEVRRDIAAKSTSAKVRRAAELAGIFVEASTTKKQPTSSVPAPLPAVTPWRRPFPLICAPPWHQQLPPCFNVARNSTPFAHNSHVGAPSLSVVKPKLPRFASFTVATQKLRLMEIFGFTPFGICCRVCMDHVGSSEQTISSHLESKNHGVFSRVAVKAIKTMADKEVERLSRQANLELYLVDRLEGFACRCGAVFIEEKALLLHCKRVKSCCFGPKEARPELLFKTVCGRTVSQATLHRLSSSRKLEYARLIDKAPSSPKDTVAVNTNAENKDASVPPTELQQPVFGFCPFAGIVCLLCEKPIGGESENIVSNMGKHTNTYLHRSKCSQLVPTKAAKATLTEFVAFAKRELLPLAKVIVVKDITNARRLLAPFLSKRSDYWHCAPCNSFVDRKRKHKYEHHAVMVKRLGHCPLHVSGCSLIIPADYNPHVPAIYSKLFQELLELETANNELKGLDTTEVEQNNCTSVPPTKKQRTSSALTPLPTVNTSWRPFQPIGAPPSHQQLPPYFNVARNNNNHVGAPPLFDVNPNLASFGIATHHPTPRLTDIFGFTPFGIYCRVCKDHVGSTEQTIFSHLQSKNHGVFSRDAVKAIKTMADKEVELLSRQANLESYLVDRSEGFTCRCGAAFGGRNALVRHCRGTKSCTFDPKEARPDFVFKTVCGRTVSQTTLDRLSSSLPTAEHFDVATTEAALGAGVLDPAS